MNRHDRFTCDPGTGTKIVYSPVLQKDGTVLLVESGKIDTDEAINIEADQCSLEAILTRYANGDLEALNRFEGIYADVSDFPKTYAEYLQHAINAENGFHRLPIEIQKKYDNNWKKWLMESGTKDWYKDLEILSNKSDSHTISDVKENEDEQEH